MTTAVYEAMSYAMRYLFLAIAVGVLIAMIVISYRDYKEKKAVLSELGQYIGYLEITKGPEQFIGDRFGIREYNTIGRSTRADIVLPDASVAAEHASIYVEGDNLVLQPGEGAIRINGRRAVRPHAIKTGDTITVGDVEFVVYIRRVRLAYDH